MTRDDFINGATPVIRQGITLVSGLLAAKGLTGVGNSLAEWAVSGSLLAASLGWALIEKSKLLSTAVAAAPTDDLSALIATVGQFRAQGASPILVAHLAQTAAALAVAETQTTAAPLAATPTVQAPPADAVVPPPPASPGVMVETDPAAESVQVYPGPAQVLPTPLALGTTDGYPVPQPVNGPFGAA